MRKLTRHFIHCSDTPSSMDIGRKEINRWHRQRGWNMVGYHFIIRRDGTIEEGRPVEMVGAGVYGYNSDSIHTCLVGRGEYTKKQFESLKKLVKRFKELKTLGHNEVSSKLCPMFDVQKWLKSEDKTEEAD